MLNIVSQGQQTKDKPTDNQMYSNGLSASKKGILKYIHSCDNNKYDLSANIQRTQSYRWMTFDVENPTVWYTV